jgi:hypothetical protein
MILAYPAVPAFAAQYTNLVPTAPRFDAWTTHMNGTGSNCTLQFYRDRIGYKIFPIIERVLIKPAEISKPFAHLMLEIKEGFGRTMTRLPIVFGVSRQTLYNWLEGDTPKQAHQAKIIELAEAARVFAAAGLKPTPAVLDRSVANGKSFLALLADGADGAAAAKSLIRIVERGFLSRARLEAALAGKQRVRPDVSDIGAPAFDEDT